MAAIGLGNVVGIISNSPSVLAYRPTRATEINNILLNIFLFLPTQHLNKCCSVNHLWNNVASCEFLWKPRNSPDVIEDFTFLVKEQTLNWKEVFLYARISRFITRLIEEQVTSSSFIEQKNPKLRASQFPLCTMPKPFLLHGNYCFSIICSTQIKILEKGKVESTIIIEDEKMFTHLAVEGDHLFALREDGKVIRLNYKTGEKIQEIDTAYSRGSDDFRRNRVLLPGTSFCNSFCVKNGIISILIFDSTKFLLEIIPYADSSKSSQLIEDSIFFGSSKTIIEEERIVIMDNNSIWIGNLLTNKREALINLNIDNSHKITDIAIDRNILYATDTKKQVHVINLKTKEKGCFRYPVLEQDSHIERITVICNLIFGKLYSKGTFNQIVVFDMNSNKFVNLKPLKINLIHTQEIEPYLIKDLIRLSKPVISKPSVSLNMLSPSTASTQSSKCIIS